MRNVIKFELEDDDGNEEEFEIPAQWAICSRCRGEGSHVNPNIDGNGITHEEWQDFDDEERETYMTGGYDVQCEAGCQDGKILVPDAEACSSEPHKTHLAAYEQKQRQKVQWDREDRATRWLESGGRE